jgi:NADPH-dependent 2,4-dienoyl-CoA reductase/sulfur reductase-like enzyme
MAGHFGMEVGTAIGNVHRSNGVRLLLDSPVEKVVRLDTGNHSVRLRNGDHITADVVIAAVGSIPNVEWLRTSGLDITDGVVCDSRCAAAPNVYAAGDIASWYSNRFGRRLRVEHRVNATEQANAAAMNLLGAARDYDPVPYFWTHQFADRIQMYGIRPSGTEVTPVLGSFEERRFVGVYEEHGVVVGAVGWNSAKQMLRMRSHILEGARLDEISA